MAEKNNWYRTLAAMALFSFVSIGSFLPVSVAQQEILTRAALVIEPDAQFSFAMKYFDSAQYFRAIDEFERFAHFFPDDPRVDPALYRTGQAWYAAGRFRQAEASFRQVVERDRDRELVVKSYFRLSETFAALQDYAAAQSILKYVEETAPEPVVRDEARYRSGWLHLRQEQFEAAKARFGAVEEQNRDRFRIAVLEAELNRDPLYPKKDPRVAGFLSVVPGAGFAYCERYRDAAAAFFLNAALILAAAESFDSGNEALGAVVSFVAAGFYGGNIYGAVSSAHKYNRASRSRFLEDLRSRAGVTLSLAPTGQGVMVGLKYAFP